MPRQYPKTMETLQKTGTAVLDAFAQSMMGGTDDWKQLIAPDMKFVGPVDQVEGRDAFIKLNEGFMPIVRNVQPLRRTEQNGLVMTEVIYTLAKPQGGELDLRMVELAEIKNGQIQSMDIYYDAEEFRKSFSC